MSVSAVHRHWGGSRGGDARSPIQANKSGKTLTQSEEEVSWGRGKSDKKIAVRRAGPRGFSTPLVIKGEWGKLN